MLAKAKEKSNKQAGKIDEEDEDSDGGPVSSKNKPLPSLGGKGKKTFNLSNIKNKRAALEKPR